MSTDERAGAGEDPESVVEDADGTTDTDERDPGTKRGSKRRHLPIWQESLLLVGCALVLAFVLKAFFVQAFYIPSESMEPGLVKNDRILVQKVSYWFNEPQRGDVVVFKDPGGWLSPTEETGPQNPLTKAMAKVGLYPDGGHLVKRVIGVAGDTIECCDDQGRIIVNGQPLDEGDYTRLDEGVTCNGPMVSECSEPWKIGPIPEGKIFVMGDNRSNSADSTVHMDCELGKATDCTDSPFVDTDEVVGKVMALVWPLDRFEFVSRPDDFADVLDPS